MQYSIDVKTEVLKIANSKPVHAAAGAGVLATQVLRELPGRLVRTIDGTVNTLPGRATGTVTSLPGRATGAVQNARAKAADGYDMLADHGKRALNGQDSEPAKNTLNGKPSTTRTSRSSTSKASTTKTRTASKTK
jgi:hypothetical protein